ncbi:MULTISPECIES: CsgG/HfaB family protein [Rhodomicrobium]|uniref:CsgG/HfaB family protein n=1 Tax=Rhodomicrobium TaxID=1068 RepID=UPI001FDA6F62|nr:MULTISPECIES: CsgG/HfaB family protein [Rhodomicrobium]
MTKLGQLGMAAALVLGLAGCSTQDIAEETLSAGILPPVMNPLTEANLSLRELPPPSRKVVVAVYNYADQTGQFKPSETTQTLSKAVTQGATSILIKALQDVGQGSWFTVVEREKIDNLLKERKIITQMRMTYLGETRIDPNALPPLLFAGIIFEGGIIGFDSNIQTGGLGARLLGIGGDLKYRLDTITIYLRAVSTKTGQVVGSVTTHKTIASYGLQGGVFKFIAVDKILEGEAGFTKNEPEQLAVQQAIEKAVYAILIEGAETDVWSFADAASQARLIHEYKSEQYEARQFASNGNPATANAKVATAATATPAPVKTAGKEGAAPAAPAATAATGSGPVAGPGGSAPPPAASAAKEPLAPAAPGAAPAASGGGSWKPSISSLEPRPRDAPGGSGSARRERRMPGGGWATTPVTVKERFEHAVTSN